MPYRPPRPGDLLHVYDGDLDRSAIVHQVIDDGKTLSLTGEWAGRPLAVDVRRVGDIHPEVTVSAMKNLLDDLHDLVSKLEEEGHVLAAAFRNRLDRLTGQARAVEKEVVADIEGDIKQP